ncbi:Serine carboxypeptidase 24 isoform B [Chlorella sorokiniana]|uniref:Carboxypeptidase n=1 Tax=Chlorella sorokiniana TaxID=3076 RepID=A0A2P6TKQ7_CHLSO|nr:Serine carboxypeptidase 24 isoform B [Chlorella sorokiniana]|eukprot:PRW44859.1 Serine carboxypeptidase 24 isoform B [Chlorella sorokiniana]
MARRRAAPLLALGLLGLFGVSWARPVDQQAGLHVDADVGSSDPGLDDYTVEAQADFVPSLPGAPPSKLRIFAGYVTVDEDAGRALFYTFVESTRSPKDDPLVLWLNGGPGCSSLGGGFLAELGPFYPTPGGEQLILNKWAWNRVANMLFLESPAFVGFSYSNSSRDARVGDARTARDARQFLLRWFDRFPQYRDHNFHISGESYAGHYIPQLASAIVRGNKQDGKEQPINLKGFLVGNAWSDPEIDNRAALAFWWSHAIVSTETRDGALKNCDFSAIGPLEEQEEEEVYVSAVEGPLPGAAAAAASLGGRRAEKCDEFVNRAMQEMGNINIYDIYADVCLTPGPSAAAAVGATTPRRPSAFPASQARQLALMLRGHPAGCSTRPMLGKHYDPCIDSETEAYLNRRDVQLALHANVSGELPGPWKDCTQAIEYKRRDVLRTILPLYRELIDAGLKILVYSGDVDAIVPVIGTRNWIRELDLPITKPWRPWTSSTGQVGGWTVEHQGLTFASVRGAGHMVPYTQPERALHLFSSYLEELTL